jgi:hypothetical protein
VSTKLYLKGAYKFLRVCRDVIAEKFCHQLAVNITKPIPGEGTRSLATRIIFNDQAAVPFIRILIL